MSLQLHCECGQDIAATEGMAGTSIPCACGRMIAVPSLREMRRVTGPDLDIAISPANDPTADNALLRGSTAVLYGAIVAWTCLVGLPLLAVLLVYGHVIAALGALLIVAGHVWLFTQIYIGNPIAALLILLVPLIGPVLTSQFIVDHWRIACWPAACQFFGFVLLVYGIL